MNDGADDKHVAANGSGELACYFCDHPPLHLVSRMSEIEALKFIGLATKEPAGKQVSHRRCRESGDRNGQRSFPPQPILRLCSKEQQHFSLHLYLMFTARYVVTALTFIAQPLWKIPYKDYRDAAPPSFLPQLHTLLFAAEATRSPCSQADVKCVNQSLWHVCACGSFRIPLSNSLKQIRFLIDTRRMLADRLNMQIAPCLPRSLLHHWPVCFLQEATSSSSPRVLQ